MIWTPIRRSRPRTTSHSSSHQARTPALQQKRRSTSGIRQLTTIGLKDQGQIGTREDDVAHQIYLGTLAQSVALVVTAPLSGKLSDHIGRRKIFVAGAAAIYAIALVLLATAAGVGGYLVGMAVGGLGFGMYMAVDLALVVDVLPDSGSSAKDLGVLNIAGALPFAIAPAVAPAVLAAGHGSYAVLYLVAGGCALAGAAAIVPVEQVR